jgi:hypothetical protein
VGAKGSQTEKGDGRDEEGADPGRGEEAARRPAALERRASKLDRARFRAVRWGCWVVGVLRLTVEEKANEKAKRREKESGWTLS